MGTRIIDGKTIAADLRGKVTDAVHRLRRDRGVVPGIAVVLVGADPASEVYVRNKSKAVAESGMRAFDCKLAVSTSEAELLDLIAKLNADEDVSGILVQLPLPKQIDAQKIIAAIDPTKDVDGFHPVNVPGDGGKTRIVGDVVREWVMVTVAFSARRSCATGLPTMFERPTTTASRPASVS